MGMSTIAGDIIQVTDKSFLFAIDGDADDTIWIPLSVVEDGEVEVDDEVELLISSWWYNKNNKRFE